MPRNLQVAPFLSSAALGEFPGDRAPRAGGRQKGIKTPRCPPWPGVPDSGRPLRGGPSTTPQLPPLHDRPAASSNLVDSDTRASVSASGTPPDDGPTQSDSQGGGAMGISLLQADEGSLRSPSGPLQPPCRTRRSLCLGRRGRTGLELQAGAGPSGGGQEQAFHCFPPLRSLLAPS